MYLLIILIQPAILWTVMYYVVGEQETPNFLSLALTFFLIAIASAFISYHFTIFQPIVSSIVFVVALTIFYRIDLVKSLITIAIFFGVMTGISLIRNLLMAS